MAVRDSRKSCRPFSRLSSASQTSRSVAADWTMCHPGGFSLYCSPAIVIWLTFRHPFTEKNGTKWALTLTKLTRFYHRSVPPNDRNRMRLTFDKISLNFSKKNPFKVLLFQVISMGHYGRLNPLLRRFCAVISKLELIVLPLYS